MRTPRFPSTLPFFFAAACLAVLPFVPGSPAAVSLSQKDAASVGQKIWRNECGGTVDGLTSWNSGEDFASLGIGHFIWYPKGTKGPFKESFPGLVEFLKESGVRLPDWLRPGMDCPWSSREEFRADFSGERLVQLRRMLAATVPQQTQFLIKRLDAALPEMVSAAPPTVRARIEQQFARLAATPQGAYALIDYVNFKGEGVLATERYKGEGWGLLQVLENMKDGDDAATEFSKSAAEILTRRVRNAPPARKEERWLPGWKKRVEGYAG